MKLLTRIRSLRGVRPPAEPELPEVARVVAIIMDGNGRWAKRRGLPVAAGHRAGTRALRRTVEAAIDLGVETLVVYAFSTENWSRPAGEVDSLMDIFGETIERELPDLARQGVRTRFIGRRDRAPAELQEQMARIEDETAHNERLNLWIAFDYGGRAELVEAARRLVEAGVEPAEIDENLLRANLYAPELPDPDLLIRTSGELRISNFLLWQLAYSELVFTETLGPDLMAAGFLTTLAFAFLLKGVSETRQSLTVAVATTVLGAGWIGLGLAHVVLLRAIPPTKDGRLAVFAVLLAVFAADTAAYCAGRLIGRHRLAPVLSPGKTWEGLIAGTVVAVLVPFFALYHSDFLDVWRSLVLGAVIAVAAPVGDLFESAVKRDLNVKDSGRLLLGHGGMLDRLDAPLFAAVASYYTILALT